MEGASQTVHDSADLRREVDRCCKVTRGLWWTHACMRVRLVFSSLLWDAGLSKEVDLVVYNVLIATHGIHIA